MEGFCARVAMPCNVDVYVKERRPDNTVSLRNETFIVEGGSQNDDLSKLFTLICAKWPDNNMGHTNEDL